MEIPNGIKILDLALYIEKEKTLVIADPHFGYEESLNKRGVLIPRFQFKDFINRLDNSIKNVEVKKIVITGDLKHEFGTILKQEWRDILEFFDYFKDKEIIIVKGNHDVLLDPIIKKRNVKLVKYYKIKNIIILHGDSIPTDKDFLESKTIIIGHEHPAISFKERLNEKFKCFLIGEWKDKKLIVLPSINMLTYGTDLTKETQLSPFLQQDLDDFLVYIVEDKVYKFGKFENLK